MDENWIDDAVSEVDRQGPRPGFEAELRTTLSDAWNGRPPAGRPAVDLRRGPRARPPRWWAFTAAAAIIMMVIAGVIVSTRPQPDTVVSPPPTNPPTPAPTTAPPSTTAADGGANGDLIASLVDRTWLITEADDVPRTYVASFTIDTDGEVTGFDGCNLYSRPMTFTADGLAAGPDGEGQMTAALCDDPYETGWTAAPGVYSVDGDTLTITTPDGPRLDAVDLASLPTLRDAPQLVGTWMTAETVPVTFTEPLDGSGSITGPCGAFGTWTFDDQLRTVIDQEAYAACVPNPQLGWVFDDLVEGSPTIRILADGSLVFGRDQFGRLLPTEQSPAPPTAGVDLSVPFRTDVPVRVVPLTTIPWGQDRGEITLSNGEFTIPVALFPDTVLVLEDLLDTGRLSGRALRVDRSTGVLIDEVRLDGVTGLPFWTSGSPDGTLYLATSAGEIPDVTVAALREMTPGVFSVVEQARPDALGDSEFRLTARGVEFGGEVMIASDAASSWPAVEIALDTSAEVPPWTTRWVVTRAASGTEQQWTVNVQFDSEFPPLFGQPTAEPVGTGVIISTFTSGSVGSSPVVSYLGGPGERGGSWDLGGWQLADQDPDAALLVRAGTDGLQLGFLDTSAS